MDGRKCMRNGFLKTDFLKPNILGVDVTLIGSDKLFSIIFIYHFDCH